MLVFNTVIDGYHGTLLRLTRLCLYVFNPKSPTPIWFQSLWLGGPVDVHGVVRRDATPRAIHAQDRGEDNRHRKDPRRAAEDSKVKPTKIKTQQRQQGGLFMFYLHDTSSISYSNCAV